MIENQFITRWAASIAFRKMQKRNELTYPPYPISELSFKIQIIGGGQ